MEDYLYFLLNLYKKLPYPIKRSVGFLYNFLPRNLRYGKFYSLYTKRIKDFSSLNDYNLIKVKQLDLLLFNLAEAIRSIPYYKKYPKCFTLEQFEKLPIINKRIIVDNNAQIINPKLNSLKLMTNTGGSSGTPMVFFLEKNSSRPKEKSHFDWFWGKFGYHSRSKILMLRGLPLANGRTFEYNSIDNILNVSCYNINETNILQIINEINKYQPDFIHGYPSSVKIITHLMEEHKNLIKLNIKSLFLGSEHISLIDREYLEEFFNAKVVSWYGHTERLIHGGNCEYSNEYHFYPYYGYVELVDDDNIPITEPGKEGRIIATGFDNKVMPFIRYDTGDLGILSERNECKCGFRGLSLKEITGRGQDFVILSDNTKVSATAFIFGQHLEAFARVREMQLQQDKAGKLEIRIIKGHGFNDGDKDNIKDELENSVENKIKIDVIIVNNIQKTLRGKKIFFISNINKF
jgi:phenylacetate-CoA ligase